MVQKINEGSRSSNVSIMINMNEYISEDFSCDAVLSFIFGKVRICISCTFIDFFAGVLI